MLESAAIMLALLFSGADTRHPATVITIPPGVYHHDSVIRLSGLHDVTINAHGATFLIPAGPIIGCVPAWIKIEDSQRVTIDGITIIDLGSDSTGCAEQSHGITVSNPASSARAKLRPGSESASS